MLLSSEYMSFYHARIRRALLLPWLRAVERGVLRASRLG